MLTIYNCLVRGGVCMHSQERLKLGTNAIMGPAAGPMACWTSFFFSVGERINPPAHYRSSSRTTGLLDKLVLPNTERFSPSARYGSSSWTNGLPTMGPAAGPMACWASLFFPLGSGLNHTAHYGSSSCTNGLLDKLVLPNRSGLVFQSAVGPAVGHWPAGQASSPQ